jgi:hypothetical protein
LAPESQPKQEILKLIPGMVLGVAMLPLGNWLSAIVGLPHWTGPLVGLVVILCGAFAYGEISMRIAWHRRER